MKKNKDKIPKAVKGKRKRPDSNVRSTPGSGALLAHDKELVEAVRALAKDQPLEHTLAVTADNLAQSKIRELQAALKWAYAQAATMEAFYAGTLKPAELFEYRRKLAMCKELLK